MAGLDGAAQMPPPPPLGKGPEFTRGFMPESSPANKTAQPTGARRYYRRRSRGACEACRGRRIRCDAMTLGAPCTNCTAFLIECIVLQGRAARKNGRGEEVEATVNKDGPSQDKQPLKLHPMQLLEQQLMEDPFQLDLYVKFMDPQFRHAPVESVNVGYVAEKSNLALLVGEETLHYPIPGNAKGSRDKLAKLGKAEVELLRQRGALSIPHWKFCDDLVEAYFQYVSPILPLLNRSRFMRQYRDPNNPPSLLLLQTMFLAGSMVTSKMDPKEAGGATIPSSMTFYKRAKALYDSDYEDDHIVTLQALILLGWYGEETGDVTKTVFYWNGLATTVAQGSGLHRNAEKARLARSDKRLWKRIWWTLFTRDRSMAVALGRPVHINIDDCDVAMICEDDFIDDEEDCPAEYSSDPLHVQFFIQYVSLCKIMSIALSLEHRKNSGDSEQSSDILKQCDSALVTWVQNCPEEVKWKVSSYNFWAALLHCAYYVTFGLRYKSYLPELISESNSQNNGYLQSNLYQLPFGAIQAASEVSSAAESMIQADEIQFSPPFMIYALTSALNIHISQMRSDISFINVKSHTCMNALARLSEVWVAAKLAFTRFESTLNNIGLQRSTRGILDLVENGESTGTPTSRSIPSQHHLLAADYGINLTAPLQFRERLRQVVPNPTDGLFSKSNSDSSQTVSSAFQTMNMLSLSDQVDYDAAIPAFIPPKTLADRLLNSNGSLPGPHIAADHNRYRILFPEAATYSEQETSGAFGPNDIPISQTGYLQNMTQNTEDSIGQKSAFLYNVLDYEMQHDYVP